MSIAVGDEGSQLSSLISRVAQAGIEIPERVTVERQLYREMKLGLDAPEGEYAAAVRQLSDVPAEEFASSIPALVGASQTRDAYTREVKTALLGIGAGRLRGAIAGVSHKWLAEVVDEFNGVVDEFDLNSVAGGLPDLHSYRNEITGEVFKTDIMDVNGSQLNALSRWREAVELLHPKWVAFTALAGFEGYDGVAPSGSDDDVSQNIMAAYVLGTPTFQQAYESTPVFVSAAARFKSVRGYDRLLPFITPLLCGFELRLSTPWDARSALESDRAA